MKKYLKLLILCLMLFSLSMTVQASIEPSAVFPLEIQRQVVACNGINAAIDNDGNAYVWGYVLDSFVSLPKKVLEGVASVDVSTDRVLLLKEDGTVWAMGTNLGGVLGDGTSEDRDAPVQIKGLSHIVCISAGNAENIALKDDGTVWVWGCHNNLIILPNPVEVENIDNVVSVSAYYNYTLLLKADGTVWYWRYEDNEDHINPRCIEVLDHIIAVSSGCWNAAALKKDGTVWEWDIGYPDEDKKLRKINDISSATGLSDGANIMIDKSGDAYLYGDISLNKDGGYMMATEKPTKIQKISDVIQLYSGGFATFVKRNGEVWTWGDHWTETDLNQPEYRYDPIPLKKNTANDTFIAKMPTTKYVLDRPAEWAKDEVSEADKLSLMPEGFDQWYNYDITRKDFCTLVVNMIEKKTGKTIDKVLADKGLTVNKDAFNDTGNSNILAAAALGIVNGKGEKLFDPSGHITRQEAAAMLYRTAKVLGYSEPQGDAISFTDSSSFADWGKDAISYVSSATDKTNNLKVMNGMDGGKFEPNSHYTRQQAIITIKRLFNVQ
ncbi:MAG: S-layer homology domain-containing protein [Bacillota bacterium]|nr:S-layer homology domain-containing protein [Bacillota bacterium]